MSATMLPQAQYFFFESAASAGGLLLGPAHEKYLGASTDVFLGVRRRHAPKAFKKETGV